jgi:hypothetical protein
VPVQVGGDTAIAELDPNRMNSSGNGSSR